MSDFTNDLRIIAAAFEHEQDEWAGYKMINQAADLIDQQQEDIGKLREALQEIRQYGRECWNKKKPPMAWRVMSMANDALKEATNE